MEFLLIPLILLVIVLSWIAAWKKSSKSALTIWDEAGVTSYKEKENYLNQMVNGTPRKKKK